MSTEELRQVGKRHQSRAAKIASVLRIGVVGLMLTAMLVGTDRSEWTKQGILLGLYTCVALYALILPFTPAGQYAMGRRQQVTFTLIDVLTLTGFQLLSTGALVPLLIMPALPILAGLDVSTRRAAVMLTCSYIGFVVAVLHDPELVHQMGWPTTLFRFMLYGFLCATSLMVVQLARGHANTISRLSALRVALLADTMTAAEEVQRRISESIHDGPLQDVLAARQELAELALVAPGDEHVDRVQACLKDASTRLREATFELHPAVLAEVGLGAAVEQLASSFSLQRSGITITTDIDYPIRNTIDPIAFGMVRELLSNVIRHSGATHASVTLAVNDHTCRLDMADNGVGVTSEILARRLGEGHIGLASHRARVEATGGRFTFLDEPVGTHIRVELPLER